MSTDKHKQSRQLRQDIVKFLTPLPALEEPQRRTSFMITAALDIELIQEINIQGASKPFCEHLYDRANLYGAMNDGRDAIIAILDATKTYVGPNEQHRIQGYIEQRQQTLYATIVDGILPDISDSGPDVLFIPFENREQEIDRIVTYPDEGSYYLIEGPAGYGKTHLLLEIKKRLSSADRNWLCSYIALSKYNSFKEVLALIVNDLNLEISVDNLERPHSIGFAVGKAIAQKRDKLKANGFCLMLDIDTDTDKELELFMLIVKDIADNFVKGVFDGLTEKANSFFTRQEKRFKFIIAGRYLTTYVYPQLENQTFKIIHLKPFDYEIVRKVCSKLTLLTFEEMIDCNNFAAHLLFYSGGHPGCMAKILDIVAKYSPNNPVVFLDKHWSVMDAIAGQQAATVRASIGQSLRETFDVLCVYPRFDYGILERLIATEELDVSVNEDAYDLAMKLKRTFLVDWADDNRLHLSDSITRRLLIVHLRHNHPREFQRRCKKAYENCTIRMREQVELRFQWGVESLTSFLQIRTNQIQNMSVRRELKEEFFKNILPDILSKLVEGRDKRVEKEPFLRAVEKHPDLRFMVNFYLREGVYDDPPYREFLQIVGQFFN